MNTLLTFLTCLGYSCAVLGCYYRIEGRPTRNSILWLATLCVLLQGILLYWAIETGAGQNLDRYNLFCLVTWSVSGLMIITALYEPVESLGILIFPLNILSVFLMWYFPEETIYHTRNSLFQLTHILSSLLALSMVALAAVQAFGLWFQAKRLRAHAIEKKLNIFPPLETMERLLFFTLWFGFGFLSVSAITGVLYWKEVQNVEVLLKLVFVMIAWGVFATLLLGRYLLKWRGTHAINWTLAGLILLIIAFVGTHYLVL